LGPARAQYWEDAADALREASGTLLPLWKFADARARRRAVTALAWSPSHADLFAAAYGSFDAQAQVGPGSDRRVWRAGLTQASRVQSRGVGRCSEGERCLARLGAISRPGRARVKQGVQSE
jgi:hypothetical protein